MRQRAVIILNPRARRSVPADRLREAAATGAPSWDVEVVETAHAGQPAEVVREALAQGAHALIACGGDGTLNSVVNAVRATGNRQVAVGVVPGGTANVWAHEAGVPRDPLGALAVLEHGYLAQVDLGVARVGDLERAFLLMCGLGLDAEVVRQVDAAPALKRRLAQGAYVVAGARALRAQRPVICTIEAWHGADGREVSRVRRSLVLAVAGNTRLYGGVSRITSDARMDDGLLDLATFEARPGRRALLDGLGHVGRGIARLRGGWHRGPAPRFAYDRAARFVIRPERALALQLDGEWFASADPARSLDLLVEPGALRVLVPPGPNPLFQARPGRA